MQDENEPVREQYELAVHEAGHAVVAHLVGVAIDRVAINSRGAAQSQCVIRSMLQQTNYGLRLLPSAASWCWRVLLKTASVVMCCARAISAERYEERPRRVAPACKSLRWVLNAPGYWAITLANSSTRCVFVLSGNSSACNFQSQ